MDMKRLFSVLIIISSLFVAQTVEAKSRLHVIEQTCEGLRDPLCIDTATPRLSWKLASTRQGDSQTAYEIEAASTIDLLLMGEPDLWRSGKVKSENSILVAYGGRKLSPRDMVYWRVRPYDVKGKPGDWSEIARFGVGFVDGAQMEGKYIALSRENAERRAPIFRKKINIKGDGSIVAYVNSLGYHELYVNGQKADQHVLQPAVSQLTKRSLIVGYDITSLLHAGENDIVVWAGQGWYKETLFKNALEGPLVKVEIAQEQGDVWRPIASTDATWDAADSGYRDLGTWNAWQYFGEKVDGRILPATMNAADLDKVNFSKAIEIDVEGIEATPQMFPGNAIIAQLKPKTVEKRADGTWLVDLGRVITGWFQITMNGLEAGSEVRMDYADAIDEKGELISQDEYDIYIAAGKGEETFTNKFNHHAYRYVVVKGVEDIASVEGLQISGDYEQTSTFQCSDRDLNTVHDLIHYTLRCLMFSGYMVDCPHIERMGYGGDGNSSTLTVQTMYDALPTYKNWMQAWRDVIHPDGGLPHVAPEYRCGGGPYWNSFIIKAPWNTYLNYSDPSLLADTYDSMCRWLDFVKSHSTDGLLRPWPDTDYRAWYLGDWIAPQGIDVTDKASVDMVNNCCISECLDKMTAIATLLGKTSDSRRFAEWRRSLNDRIHAEFYHPEDSTYASRVPIDIAYALVAGVVPENLRQAVSDKLERLSRGKYNSHIAVGLTGVPIFTEWAVDEHKADLMADILRQHDAPGYLYMVDHGATATWEYWTGRRSYVHNCFNGIGSWFYNALAGINNDKTIKRKDDNSTLYTLHSQLYTPTYTISPQLAKGIDWVKSTRETPYGQIAVEWHRTGTTATFDIEIPVGLKVAFSSQDVKRITHVNGKRHKADVQLLILHSGKHRITVELQ